MGIKANKRAGHAAEAEAAEITKHWPMLLRMQRTGLDGGADLTGTHAVAEVKRVKNGPAWLQSMLEQLDSRQADHRLGLVKLSRRRGNRVGWLVVMDVDEFERLLKR